MSTEPVLLADRFEVRPALNAVMDKTSGKEIRLEARLMKLLCLLMEHEGQLVSREYITKEIWDDYGNADEGLTQSISYLRKVLGDEQKRLIETVPKKGYVLRARVSNLTVQQPHPAENISAPKHPSKRLALILAVGVIGLALVLFLLLPLLKKEGQTNPDIRPETENTNGNPDKPSPSDGGAADVFKIDSDKNLAIDTLIK